MVSIDEINAVLALRDPFRRPDGKFDSALLFKLNDDLGRAVPNDPTVGESFVYYSPLRPTHASARVPGATAVNDRWWHAESPIAPETIVRLNLQPIQLSLAAFLYDSSLQLHMPIELIERPMPEDGFRAAVLFVNPKKRWQVSWFQDGIGPTGHIEGDDPVRLLRDAIQSYGFRHWHPEAIDLIGQRLSSLPHDNPDTKRASKRQRNIENYNATVAKMQVMAPVSDPMFYPGERIVRQSAADARVFGKPTQFHILATEADGGLRGRVLFSSSSTADGYLYGGALWIKGRGGKRCVNSVWLEPEYRRGARHVRTGAPVGVDFGAMLAAFLNEMKVRCVFTPVNEAGRAWAARVGFFIESKPKR